MTANGDTDEFFCELTISWMAAIVRMFKLSLLC